MEKTLQARELRPVRPQDLPPAEKLRLVMEASALPDSELGAFLRQHGLHEAQLDEWRRAALDALQAGKKSRRQKSPEAKKLNALERELARKDKALAEVTALLALKKKLDGAAGTGLGRQPRPWCPLHEARNDVAGDSAATVPPRAASSSARNAAHPQKTRTSDAASDKDALRSSVTRSPEPRLSQRRRFWRAGRCRFLSSSCLRSHKI